MPIGVGVIGAGTVGSGVIENLLARPEILEQRTGVRVTLKHVAEVNAKRLKGLDLGGVKVSRDAAAVIADPEVQVVCELIGGLEPAKQIILDALAAGKHVVTANKMLIAHHGPELTRAAVAHGVDLRYEAAVCGCIPIIKALREGLTANRISFVYGILNGTCNYILTRMTYEALEFDEVLKQAIERGFAETPPDLDIQGLDTAHKCQIIASLCYSTEIDLDDIYVEGVTKVTHADVAYARRMGYVIKLLAIVRLMEGAVDTRVHPTLVPENHLLASVRNEFNAVYVQGDIADATLYYGRGAGRLPTTSAVLADIGDIARRGPGPAPPPFIYGERRPVRSIDEHEGHYYLRVTTADRPGVLGRIGTILGAHGVSIASCSQEQSHAESDVHLVIMTHDTREKSLRAALREVDTLEFIGEPTHVLRVL